MKKEASLALLAIALSLGSIFLYPDSETVSAATQSRAFVSETTTDKKVSKSIERMRAKMNRPSIKVLVVAEAEGVMIEVKGGCRLYDPATGKKVGSRMGKAAFYMQPTNDGLRWGEAFPGIYQLLIQPDDLNTTILVSGTEYKGWVFVYDVEGDLFVVNEVPFEDFIASLLYGHIGDVQEQEALSALVILARTDALYRTMSHKSPYWDIKAEEFGYQGKAVVAMNTALENAIKVTKDMILSKGKLSKQIVDPFAVPWIALLGQGKTHLPEVFVQSESKKDAKKILDSMFPEAHLALIPAKKRH